MRVPLHYLNGPDLKWYVTLQEKKIGKTEPEIGVRQPQAREHLHPPEAEWSKVSFSPRAFGGSVTHWPLDFWLLASRTMWEYVSVVQSHPVYDIFFMAPPQEMSISSNPTQPPYSWGPLSMGYFPVHDFNDSSQGVKKQIPDFTLTGEESDTKKGTVTCPCQRPRTPTVASVPFYTISF